MIIHNPTDEKVSVVVNGHTHEVDPHGDVVVEDADGERWLQVHEFLQVIHEVKEVIKEEMVEVKKVVEEAVEEVKDVIEAVEDVVEKVVEKVKAAKKK